MSVTVGTVTTDPGEAVGEGNAAFPATIDAGSDRLVTVDTHTADTGAGTNVNGVTIDGVAATFLARIVDGTSSHTERWYMLEADLPASGSKTVDVDWGEVTRGGVTVTNYSGVDQTTPFGTHETATGTDPSVSVSASDGDLVSDAITTRRGDTSTISAGAGQTERSNFVAGGTNTTSARCGTSTEPGAASVTMSWTASANPTLIAVPILQSASEPLTESRVITTYQNDIA